MYPILSTECIETFTSKQFQTVLIVMSLTAASCIHISWASPSIPLLTSHNSPIGVQLTKDEASWVVSAWALGAMAGSLSVTFLVDEIGRKKTMMLGAILVFASCVFIIIAKSFIALLAMRILAGSGAGLALGVNVIPLYIGEIAETKYRGTLCSITSVGKTIGSVIVYSVGPFVSFITLAVVCAILPAMFFVGYYFIPESPYYLIKRKRRQSAHNTLKCLTKLENVTERLEEIEKTIQNDNESKVKIQKLLFHKLYRKSFMILIALKTFQICSGLIVIVAYMQTIMKESRTSLSQETSSLIFAAIQIPCGVLSSFLVDKLGRRPLLIISSSGCALSLAGEGLYFYLQSTNVDLSSAYFVPTLCLTLYFVMASFGITTLPYVAAGELFTSNCKKVSGAVFAFYVGLLTFVSSKIFNPVVENLGMHAAFWCFACVCLLGVPFGLFVMPETKGKTFDEIQEILNGSRKQLDDNSVANKQERY